MCVAETAEGVGFEPTERYRAYASLVYRVICDISDIIDTSDVARYGASHGFAAPESGLSILVRLLHFAERATHPTEHEDDASEARAEAGR